MTEVIRYAIRCGECGKAVGVCLFPPPHQADTLCENCFLSLCRLHEFLNTGEADKALLAHAFGLENLELEKKSEIWRAQFCSALYYFEEFIRRENSRETLHLYKNLLDTERQALLKSKGKVDGGDEQS